MSMHPRQRPVKGDDGIDDRGWGTLVTMSDDVRRIPQRVPVCITLEAQMVDDLRGRRVRVIDVHDQWDARSWHVYGKGVEHDKDGNAYVEVLPADEYWRLRHTRQVDVTRVVRWPAAAVFLD